MTKINFKYIQYDINIIIAVYNYFFYLVLLTFYQNNL